MLYFYKISSVDNFYQINTKNNVFSLVHCTTKYDKPLRIVMFFFTLPNLLSMEGYCENCLDNKIIKSVSDTRFNSTGVYKLASMINVEGVNRIVNKSFFFCYNVIKPCLTKYEYLCITFIINI